MYTIGQVAKLVHLPISTIRYYDKEGLFPTLERTSGIRKFSEKELESLRMIEMLSVYWLISPTPAVQLSLFDSTAKE